jgi:hypothetical protein
MIDVVVRDRAAWEDLCRRVEAEIDGARAMIPRWVRRIELEFVEKQEHEAEIHVRPRYRNVTIRFGVAAISFTQPELRWAVRHELAHIILYPLQQWGERLLDALPKDVRRLHVEAGTDALESVTSDVAWLVEDLLSIGIDTG